MPEQQALAVREEAPLQQAEPSLLQVVAAAAANPAVDVAKMQALLDMQERILARQAEQEFARAMQAAQAEMVPIVRDAENKHTGSRYATLEAVDAKIRPIYSRHGFALTFGSLEAKKEGAVRVCCDVLHWSGARKRYELEGDLDLSGSKGTANKTSIQALGSTTHYLQRYLQLMIFNLVTRGADNDGQSTATLTKFQIDTLTDMLNALNLPPARVAKFFELMHAENLAGIRQADFGSAWNFLKTLIVKQQEGRA